MYQALYRKWRPKTFDDVTGQNHVTSTLKNEVSSNRISHAYLFTGSRGTGKTSCAKIMAKAINCLNSTNGNPCGKCEICESVHQGNMLDIVEIDAASNNGVENIRSMHEEVVFSPSKGKYRVYIVDEVHMLSTGAFNAFLKILEEPPSHVVFILATTEVHKLPATIISRCQRFDFYRINPFDILKRIEYICKKENIQIENEAAKLIANSADGAMRDALSILDQCANAYENNIKENDVKNILGISGSEYISDIVSCIYENNPAKCLEIINQMYLESKSMIRLCEEITEYFRIFMIFKITGEIENNIYINPDLFDINLEDILSSLDILQESYRNINSGTNSRIEMEIALIKLCSICGRKNSIKNNSKPSVNTIKQNGHTSEQESLAPPVEPPVITSSNNTEPMTLWGTILEHLKNDKSLKSLYISLKNSSAYKKENYILIDSSNSLAFELLRRSEYRSAIKKIIKNVTGKPYNLGPYTKEENNEFKKSSDQKTDLLDELITNAEKGGVNITLN